MDASNLIEYCLNEGFLIFQNAKGGAVSETFTIDRL